MHKEPKNSNSGINGVVIAFTIFGALFAAIAFMSATTFLQVLKMQDDQSSNSPIYSKAQVKTPICAKDMPMKEFDEYMATLQRDIRESWDPPKKYTSLHTVLQFKIGKNGELKSCTVYKSSGDKEADEYAIQAVKDVAPFAPLPEKYNKDDIDVQFTFDYNVTVKEN